MTTILIVDDEIDMRQLIDLVLVNSGFQTIHAENGAEAYQIISRQAIDLVLLDVMMPGEDGFEVCQAIHAMTMDKVPIIFLTARDAKDDKVKGLMIGGDDYIVKPFTAEELVARIYAVLRRSGGLIQEPEVQIIQHGVIKLDEISRKVFIEDELIMLTLKEFELLYLFMKHPNNVYSREQLLEHIWDLNYSGGTRTVDTHIKTLRIKLGKKSKEASDYIQTVWGVGYRFEKVL
ncbi:response regulator transcription factor [Solibacillus sp. FSL R7-0668]|uniref:response regulator transcription factor n=1 Tax=Solibacillus sp. FSL R7-0668 TaxID=2921688 RepID=UPI0030F8AADB